MHGRVIRFVEFEFIGVGRIPRKNRGSASAYAQGHGNDAHCHSARNHLQGFYGVRVSPPDPQGGRAAQFACDPAVAVCVEGRWGAECATCRLKDKPRSRPARLRWAGIPCAKDARQENNQRDALLREVCQEPRSPLTRLTVSGAKDGRQLITPRSSNSRSARKERSGED